MELLLLLSTLWMKQNKSNFLKKNVVSIDFNIILLTK